MNAMPTAVPMWAPATRQRRDGLRSRDDVGDQQDERHGRGDLHERPHCEGDGRRQLSLGRDQVDRRGHGEHHQHVDVAAAHRVEQHHGVEPDHGRGVGLALRAHAAHEPHHEPERPQARRHRHERKASITSTMPRKTAVIAAASHTNTGP